MPSINEMNRMRRLSNLLKVLQNHPEVDSSLTQEAMERCAQGNDELLSLESFTILLRACPLEEEARVVFDAVCPPEKAIIHDQKIINKIIYLEKIITSKINLPEKLILKPFKPHDEPTRQSR